MQAPPAAVDDTTDGGVWVCQHTPPPAAQRHTEGRGGRRRLGTVTSSRLGVGRQQDPQLTAWRCVYRQGKTVWGGAAPRSTGGGALQLARLGVAPRGCDPAPWPPASRRPCRERPSVGGGGSGSRRPRQGGACGQGGGSGGRACDTPAPPSRPPWEVGEAEMVEKTAAARATRAGLPMGRCRGCVPSGRLSAATASASDPDRLGGSVRSTSSFALPAIELTQAGVNKIATTDRSRTASLQMAEEHKRKDKFVVQAVASCSAFPTIAATTTKRSQALFPPPTPTMSCHGTATSSTLGATL